MQQGHKKAAAGSRGLVLAPACAAGLAAALLGTVSPVAADESPPGEETSVSGGPLQEIIVHGRRREERIQDTPMAITAISGEELREQSAELLEDVGRDVPNVRMVASPQSVLALDVTIRGQTVNRDAITFDPAVGLYIDGVYVANGQGSMATLLDVDSVEVIRGSQGTLFGRNNTGGSISLRSHRPDLQQVSGEVALAGGNWGQFMDRAIINVPFGSEFAVRLAYQGNDRSGFGSSVAPNGQDNLFNQHRYQARFGALWKPGEATEVYLTYERFKADEYGAILHPLTGPPPGTLVNVIGQAFASVPIPGLPPVSFPTDIYQTDASFPAFDDAQTDSVQLTASHKFGNGFAIKLIAAYRYVNANTALDVDASTLPLADTTLYNTSNQKSAELQLSDKAFADRLDWVAGLYWFHDNGGAPSVQSPASPEFLGAVAAFDAVPGNPLSLCPPPPPPPAPQPPPTGILCIFPPLPVYEQNWITNSSSAAYLHGEYQLTTDWAAAAGVRYTYDTREVKENSYVVPPVPGNEQFCTILDTSLPPPYMIGGPCPPIDKTVNYGYWSWEFSTRYRLSPELNSYLRIGHSQRSGGWNVPLATLQDQPFQPETLTDYELGLKATLLGGALDINGDVFYGNYDDMQRLLARINPDGTPVTLITNAGHARIGGAELEVLAWLTSRASLQASLGWTDAHYQSFLYQPAPYAPAAQQPPPLDLSGNEFYQTPRLQANLGGSYQWPTSAGNLLVHADYAWQDTVQFNVINDFNYQKPYGTLNARVALASHRQTWELALYADNLTDRQYAYTGGTLGAPLSPAPTIAWQVPGARRTAGVEGTYRWNPPR